MPKLYFNNKRYADLPLHYGKVPPWLAERMSRLGIAILQAIISDYGKSAVLSRMSDPFWFQSLGCVLGMDWHSSGITTSVMGALKRAVNPRSNELGIYICGGKGKHSRNTPHELINYAEKKGLNGEEFAYYSRLTARVDNNAIQDGFQIYLHSFVISDEGKWTVIQQGMNNGSGMARRYHWHSENVRSFTEEPHTSIYGKNQGLILNLTDQAALPVKDNMLEIVRQDPAKMIPEIQRLIMPLHHEIKASDINLKRLGSVLALAHENEMNEFKSLLMIEGVGPRTIQSLALVSEIIHGSPSRFNDPARFSFAHGGKDGHPFPVPTKVYDETIDMLRSSVEKAKIGYKEKSDAIRNLALASEMIEKNFEPDANPESFAKLVEKERDESYKYGGRTVYGKAKKPADNLQLRLF